MMYLQSVAATIIGFVYYHVHNVYLAVHDETPIGGATTDRMNDVAYQSSTVYPAENLSSNMLGQHGTSRVLAEQTSTDQQQSSNDAASLMFITVIAGFICLFYLFCMVQCLKMWVYRIFFRRDVDTFMMGRAASETADGTVLVHEGRVFALTGDQRRAVLEAIFSETSKAATDADIASKKKRRNRNGRRGSNGNDMLEDLEIEIPGVPTIPSTDAGSSHGGVIGYNAAGSPAMEGNEDDDNDLEEGRCVGSLPFSDEERLSALGDSIRDFDLLHQEESSSERSEEDHIRLKIAGAVDIASIASDADRAEDVIANSTQNAGFDEQSIDANMPSIPLSEESPPEHRTINPDDNTSGTPVLNRSTSLVTNSSASVDDESEGATNTPKQRNMSSLTGQSVHEEEGGECSAQSTTDDGETHLPASLDLPTFTTPKQATRKQFVIPEDEEVEEKEEIEGGGDDAETNADADADADASSSSLVIPYPLNAIESFRSVDVYSEDDETATATTATDNVCPICLSGYKKGDIICSSKYCIHSFHKDCILEWLEKHNECPVCRQGMVTDSEINRAATQFVGKTRMYRAVATFRSAPSNAHIRPRSNAPGGIFLGANAAANRSFAP